MRGLCATAEQCRIILHLLESLGQSTRVLTPRACDLAGASSEWWNQFVASWLESLTEDAADGVIDRLQDHVS